MTEPIFRKVTLIGVGLIGSSLARALRLHGLASEVVGCDSSEVVRAKLTELGVVDRVIVDVGEACRDADLVTICVPVGAYTDVARAFSHVLKPGATVTDVGSVKVAVIEAVTPHLPEGVHFVPGHPVAGTEHSGPESGFAELFEDRFCILTPPAGAEPAAVDRVAAMWTGVGSTVEIMDAEHHDKVLAITSHLPHLIAYTIVATASDLEGQLMDEKAKGVDRVTTAEVVKYSAGGFRDFTRIAASDPIMWRDVFLNNRAAVLEMLGRFSEDLTALRRAIRWSQGDLLESVFTRTREIRRGIIEAHQAGRFDPTEPTASESKEE
ncbi:MAG: prephenate/arogenate dehydrogenase family protein [Alphaproteobacteria bacterium]